MLKEPDVNYLFKLANDDFKNYGNSMRMGQAIMNNLRVINYNMYTELTESEIDPFYIEENVMPALVSISDPNSIHNILNKYHKDAKTNDTFKIKIGKLL